MIHHCAKTFTRRSAPKTSIAIALMISVIIAHPLIAQESTNVAIVPSLKFADESRARQIARVTNLTSQVGVFVIKDDNWRQSIDPKRIYLQSFQPGAVVPKGTTIGMWKLRKAEKSESIINTPDLRGLRHQAAIEIVNKAGLGVMNDETVDQDYKDFAVADQYPRPGQPVMQGTDVFIMIHRLHESLKSSK